MAKTDLNGSDISSELFSEYISHRNTVQAVCLALCRTHLLFDPAEGGNVEEVGNLFTLLSEQLESSFVLLSGQLLNRGAPPLKAVGSDLVIDPKLSKS